jgi:hypothetical protein
MIRAARSLQDIAYKGHRLQVVFVKSMDTTRPEGRGTQDIGNYYSERFNS